MFTRILIANRGEIACRIIRTARRMGIATVAVYSTADADALHVELADAAWPIGAAPARDSYLAGARIIDAARAAGAQAVHPGYGFLSENADFAAACAEAGLVFIGPPPASIRAMGGKAAAKALMQQAGVPVVPGYHGADQSLPVLAEAAAVIGYPVLVKASAGGGGRGMRVVEAPDTLAEAVASAAREAQSAFGDARLLLERYLARPRHIEVQVFADSHGACLSLFERDCSIQRRHQKVIEEAPAPGLDPRLRAAMGEAAVAAARAVGYVGAGTVEFIVEDDRFYFMEMNTRLQVEHPVTEMVTGLDLVEWQIRVAAGEGLPRRDPALRGHAIEARIYAEDPARDYLPATGQLLHLRAPLQTAEMRVETGVRAGDVISPWYDAMIAKLVVWGEDRPAAVRRLAAGLAAYEVAGVATNLGLLRRIACHPAFAAAALDTGFIARHAAALLPPAPALPRAALAAGVLAVLAALQPRADPADPWSPWTEASAWRLHEAGWHEVVLRHEATEVAVRATPLGEARYRLDLPERPAVAWLGDSGTRLWLDGVMRRVALARLAETVTVVLDGGAWVLHQADALAPPPAAAAAESRLTAPIPARVARVLVREGDTVARGAALIVLEAMKMEFTLSAPRDGTIASVGHAADEMVAEGAELVRFAEL
jgi:3-methylcrotonyl-CoA carboxylase alpha subunit